MRKNDLFWIFFIVPLLFVTGCANESTFVESPLPEEEGSETSPKKTTVSFSIPPNLQENGIFASEINTGSQLKVFAYIDNQLIKEVSYLIYSANSLKPLSEPMKLITGTYDFYVFTSNDPFYENPGFTNGVSSTLSNDVDYLWGKLENIEVREEPLSLPITLTHRCAKINLELEEAFLTFVHEIDSAFISAPAGSQSMNIQTGIITPATMISNKLITLNIDDMECEIIILPIQSQDSLEAVFKLWTNLHLESKTFSVKIPLPDNKLEAGYLYEYELIVKENIFGLKTDSVVHKTPL